jgi:hypothetical protein
MDPMTVPVTMIAFTEKFAVVEYNGNHYLVELGMLNAFQGNQYTVEGALLASDNLLVYMED